MGSRSQGSRGVEVRQGSLAYMVTFYRSSFPTRREAEAGPWRPVELPMAAKLALPSLLGGQILPCE